MPAGEDSGVPEAAHVPSLISPFDGMLAVEAALGLTNGPPGGDVVANTAAAGDDRVGLAIRAGFLFADHCAALECKDAVLAGNSRGLGFLTEPELSPGGPLKSDPPDWSLAFTECGFRAASLPGGRDARTVAAVASWFQSLRHLTRRIPAEAAPGLVTLLRNPAWVMQAQKAMGSLPPEWRNDPRVIILGESLAGAAPLVSCGIKESLPADHLIKIREIADRVVAGLSGPFDAGGRGGEILPADETRDVFTGSKASGIARKLAERYRSKGFAVAPTGDAGTLAPGQSVRFAVPVTRGLDYVFLVVTDRPGADFDISVRDDEGGLIMDDRRPDRFAGVQFRSGYTGTAIVIVSLGSREEPADWVFLAGRRPVSQPAWQP